MPDYNQAAPEETATDLLNQLNQRMAAEEDVDAAISVYKTANYIISRLEEVKRQAVSLAEQDMRLTRQKTVKTNAGSAGWTRPRVRQLDERAWRQAVVRNPNLEAAQREYEQAAERLRAAQEPYMRLPDPVFFIR